MMKPFILILSLFCSVCFANVLSEPGDTTQANIDIQEWLVPWPNTRPRDPAVDSTGNVWFCGQGGNYIAVFNPNSKKFKRFKLSENTHPHNLIIDSNDNVWYAGNRNSHIGKLNPKTGDIKKFIMPGDTAIDPHTLVFNSQQNIWFTAQWGNKVGFLNRKTKHITLVDMPFASSRPYGIKVDHQDVPWVVLFGSNKLLSINPENFRTSIVELRDAAERPRRLEISETNDVYYLDHKLGYLGRHDPKTQNLERWRLPEGHKAKLYGSAIDSKNRIWLALTGTKPNKIKVFDSKIEQFIGSVDVPSGAGSIRYMYYHRQSDEVWFGTDANTIGRVRIKRLSYWQRATGN